MLVVDKQEVCIGANITDPARALANHCDCGIYHRHAIETSR